jgi:hypothetical protein
MLKTASTVFFLSLILSVSGFAQSVSSPNAGANGLLSTPADYERVRATKVVKAIRIQDKITLDGRLDEPAWQLAPAATDFFQQQPHAGELSPEQTDARFLYDDDNMYVGLFLHDSATPVVTSISYDFQPGESDNINVVFDSLRDHRSGFSFTTNPAGGKRDQQISNDGQGNLDWTGVWDVRTSAYEGGWIAEFVIPFKTLRFSKAASQEWGLNIGRRLMRLNEISQWAPLPVRYSQFRVSLAGTLTGLENIKQGRNLKLKPFVTAGISQARASDGQLRTLESLGTRDGYDGGVDLKYSLTPSVTLDATYRTDFAQVEVDQQQVNLTRFSLFFPEKREFFLENVGNFAFGTGVGYRPAQANLVPFFSRRIGLSDAGTPIPILGGSRVSGKIKQYDIGLLAMKTDKLGTVLSNNYLVGRVKRNLFRNSWIGSIVTSRDSTAVGDYNRVYGADAHLQFYQKLEFDSYLLASDTGVYKAADRSAKNQARRFETAWIDDELAIVAEYNAVQTNFNPEMGFIRRKNMSQYAGEFTWKPRLTASDTIQSLTFGTTADYYKNGTTGKVETRTQEGTLGITFESAAAITFVTTQTFDRLVTPFLIRSDISIPAGDYKYTTYSPSFQTNPSKKISGNADLTWGEFWNGREKSLGGGLSFKPNYHLNVNLTYRRNDVRLANGEFTTDLFGARFTYGFTPRAFLNAFFQYNADTHQVSTNIRFNITHHPLSNLYIVYNDTRNTDGAIIHPGQLVGRAFIIKLDNLFSF